MKIILQYLALAFLLFSCNGNKQESRDEMPAVYPPSVAANLNTEKGNQIDQFSFQESQRIQKRVLLSELDQVEYRILQDSSMVEPANIRIVKAGNHKTIPRKGVEKVEAGTPQTVKIDSAKLRIITPGENNFPSPRIYHLPEPTAKTHDQQMLSGEFTVQHSDTIYAPVITRAGQPEPVRALPMRLKDAAIYNIQYISLEQGLHDSNIQCIFEDSRGNIWFGSGSAGICRYDGNSLTYYNASEGFKALSVYEIIEDRNNNIWIATAEGIYKYDGKHFIYYLIQEFSGVHSITESENGNIWAGTSRGILEYNGDTWTTYGEHEGLTFHTVNCILEDRSGNIWATGQSGIIRFDGRSITHFGGIDGFGEFIGFSIAEDKSGNIWFGTGNGVIKYNGKSFVRFSEDEGLSHYLFRSMLEDRSGDIWFGTSGGGITRFDGVSFSHYTSAEGFDNFINSIIEDDDNNIWIGTQGNGIMKFRKNSFVYFTQFEYMASGEITSIIEDRSGNICFGTWGGGLYRYNGNSFDHLTENEGLITDYIISMTEDRAGKLWLSFSSSLYSYDGESFTDYYTPVRRQGNLSNDIRCMHKYTQGNIWIGTWGEGITKFDGESYHPLRAEMSLPGGAGQGAGRGLVTSVVQDGNGSIWYGTIGLGLLKYDGSSIIHYDPKGQFIHWNVHTLYIDKNGNLWIGTATDGVCRFDGETFTFFTVEQGLSDNFVCSVIEDHGGNIWVGTRKGLSVFIPRENGNYTISRMGTEDGLKYLRFNENSVCLDSQNRLWWGTGEIVTMLDLNTFEILSNPPRVQLSNIQLNQDHVNFEAFIEKDDTFQNSRGIKLSGVSAFYNYPIDLELPHNQNYLTFNYSAIYWLAPQAVRYQYILDGMEKAWGPLTRDTKADYRNLSPGKYNFKIRAAGRANVMSETLEYPFRIRRPLWFRWWALSFYGIVIMLLTRYYIRFIISRERIRSDLRIQQVEVEKMQEVDQLKSRFFTSISHEFRTPLTLIIGPIERLMKKKDREVTLKRNELGILHRNAKRLQQLINQILDISKLETGKVRLQVSEGNLTEFIRRIILSFLSLAESKSIEYEYELPDLPETVFFDTDKLEKIITNLVSNAFKFTPPGGRISVILNYSIVADQDAPASAKIAIKDSGKGIPEDQMEKIFDRFYQVGSSDTREYEGTGIGLSLAKELVDIYRGEISVVSEPGKGTVFTVSIPVARDQFKEEEMIATQPLKPGRLEPQPAEIMEDVEVENVIMDNLASVKNSEQPIILIIEDNADLRHYIAGNLHDQFQIMESENGRRGLDRAIAEIPDLIITDLMMPEMDGIELCERIRSDQRTSHIPIIMLTARADKDSKLKGLETGADDYLIKPFDTEELQVRANNLIRQRRNLRDIYQAEFVKSDPFTVEIPELEDAFLARVVDCILEHLGEHEFGVEHLARDIGFSRSQLHRKLRSITGYVPNRFIRNIRLKQAARMFQEGHTNITQVLYSVGFNSPSHFSQCFREFFGVNPSVYLKQNS